ncbi:hypothetical protein BH09SUM1_BH09SUM1_13540 [soil metagenome]
MKLTHAAMVLALFSSITAMPAFAQKTTPTPTPVAIDKPGNPEWRNDAPRGRYQNDRNDSRYRNSPDDQHRNDASGTTEDQRNNRGGRDDWSRGSTTNYTQLTGDALKGDKNLLSTLERAGNFTIFLKAIEKGEMKDKLKKNEYTIFAPTDAAFARIPAEKLTALLNNRDAIRNVVRRHVVEGKLSAADIAKKGALENLEKEFLPIERRSDRTRVNGATVLQADVPANNGKVHVVNTVFVRDSDYATPVSSKSKDDSKSSSDAAKQAGIANIIGGLFGAKSAATPAPTKATPTPTKID